jgi:hypothetical protein
MTILEFIVSVLGVLVWPATVLAIFYFLRTPIRDLLPLLERLKYKDFELIFRRTAEEARQSIAADGAQIEATHELIVIDDPRTAVLDAWTRLEIVAEEKLKDLLYPGTEPWLGPDRALGYFEYMGALIPRTRAALSQLRMLRNQALHNPDATISPEGAKAYIGAVESVTSQIRALTSLPQIKLNRLTLLILEYNHLLDTGKYNHITIDDVHREIKKGTVLRYIAETAVGDADLSLYLGVKDELGFEQQYAKHLQSIYGGYAGQERRKWGVENSGLCLLIAWTNEIVQQGSGWQPNENVA